MHPPNIIVIVIDTMRKDALDFYIRNNPNNPLSREFTEYTNLIATSPWTIPSHASIFVGKYLYEHGIHKLIRKGYITNFEAWNTPKFKHKSAPQYLRELGYTTYGMSENISVSAFTGFDVGFDVFQYFDFPFNLTHREADSSKDKSIEKFVNYPSEKGSREVLQILRGTSLRKPFFLFLNLMEMHEPYKNNFSQWDQYREKLGYGKFSPAKAAKVRESYYQETTKVAYFIENFISLLKSNNEYEDSLIIVTSDHGQSLWEGGFGGHGTFLYDELLKIPLMIKYPGQYEPYSVNALVSLVDFLPLILETANGEKPIMQTREIVFSEVYGITHNLDRMLQNFPTPKHNKVMEALFQFETHRVAVYRGEFKLLYDVTNESPIEFMYKGKKTSPKDHLKDFLELSNEVSLFCETRQI